MFYLITLDNKIQICIVTLQSVCIDMQSIVVAAAQIGDDIATAATLGARKEVTTSQRRPRLEHEIHFHFILLSSFTFDIFLLFIVTPQSVCVCIQRLSVATAQRGDDIATASALATRSGAIRHSTHVSHQK
jgi:hypothetical protein